MANGNGNGSMALANRLGTWAVIAGLGMYMLNIGSWVGAADEKFKHAEDVGETQQEIKQRLTTLESDLEHVEERQTKEHDAILRAIEKLEKKLDEMRDNE